MTVAIGRSGKTGLAVPGGRLPRVLLLLAIGYALRWPGWGTELLRAGDPASADDVHAMGRFAKKYGDSLYMCYVETHDWPAVRGRLLEANARYTPRGSDPVTVPDGGWIHPKELHGLLLGVSRTGLAWDWSGRKELVPPP